MGTHDDNFLEAYRNSKHPAYNGTVNATFHSGRPVRMTVIDDLDIAYLKHQLETAPNFELFLKNT